jgi:hypothetical protein
MFLLAWRQTTLDRWRTLVTTLALGSVVAVILVLQGFEQGQYHQLERAILDRGGDLIVTQSGVDSFFARSSIPQLARAEVEAVRGVRAVHPMTVVPVIYEKHGRRTPILVFVTDSRGGPRTMIEGRDVAGDRDLVVDRALAVTHGIRVGDPFIVSDFEFTVSGIARGAAAFFAPFAFISYDGMIDFFLESELAPDISAFPLLSFMLVDLEPASDPTLVAADIQARVPAADVFTPERMAEQSVALGRTFLAPIMGLLVLVAYVIALLVVAMIMYVEVATRLQSFAVLKAVGFDARQLSQTVLCQAGLLLLLALPSAFALAQGTAIVVQYTVPLYEMRPFEPATFMRTLLGVLICGAAGALVPLRAIRQADPMLAFQEP